MAENDINQFMGLLIKEEGNYKLPRDCITWLLDIPAPKLPRDCIAWLLDIPAHHGINRRLAPRDTIAR